MKAAIMFLILLCHFAFAQCDCYEDIYMLKTGDVYFWFLKNYGDIEYSDSMFNKDYPQYANKTKKTLRPETDDISFLNMGEKYSGNPTPLRKVVIVE